jgi:septal ring factor EnvC (AmiA/AmiB activator)
MNEEQKKALRDLLADPREGVLALRVPRALLDEAFFHIDAQDAEIASLRADLGDAHAAHSEAHAEIERLRAENAALNARVGKMLARLEASAKEHESRALSHRNRGYTACAKDWDVLAARDRQAME